MADNNNNDIDIDIETQDDFDQELSAKPSLKEAWESNPVMKIAALVLGGVILIGGYLTFFGGKDEADNGAIVRAAGVNVKAQVGTEEFDETYKGALEAENQKRADEALKTGSSALPTPIGTPSQSGLAIPEAPEGGQVDPLTAWRAEAEKRRSTAERQIMEEEEAPQPEVVPLVQPVRPAPVAAKADPEAAKRLAAQMRVIIAAQAPAESRASTITEVPSAYVEMKAEQAKLEQQAAQMQAAGIDPNNPKGEAKALEKVIVSAGSILYAQLMNQLNSDLPGPVLVNVLSGPFTGGRAIGRLEVRDEYLVLTFNRVIKDGVVYNVNAIAMDEETTLIGHQSDVDHHYFTRVILPAAAEFVKGYAGAVAETGTNTTTTDGGGVATEEPEPDATEELLAGVEEAGDKVSEILDEQSERPITVHVDKGTTMGILFLDSVTTKSAGL